MKISELLNKARKDKKLLEAEVLLAHVLGESREWVLSHDREEVSSEDMRRFHELWVRLNEGEPLAYLVKKKEFYGHDFYVDKRVLVPRPETELLVEEVLRLSGDARFANKKNVRIIDVGTGSGVIAVSLAKSSDRLEVLATEFSEGAHEVAKENCKGLSGKCGFGTKFIPICAKETKREEGVSNDTSTSDESPAVKLDKLQSEVYFSESPKGVDLRLGDLLEPAKDEEVDIVVANLPYIGLEKHDLIDENVAKHEPDEALYGGSDGLDLYRKLFQQIKDYQMAPKYILGEIGFSQGSDLEKMASEVFPKKDIEIKQDLSGLDRVFIITLR